MGCPLAATKSWIGENFDQTGKGKTRVAKEISGGDEGNGKCCFHFSFFTKNEDDSRHTHLKYIVYANVYEHAYTCVCISGCGYAHGATLSFRLRTRMPCVCATKVEMKDLSVFIVAPA